jgi:hypothetical protein
MPEPTREDERRWFCRTCGLVRDADERPWCRHNDPAFAMPAVRMEPIPSFHPLANGPLDA